MFGVRARWKARISYSESGLHTEYPAAVTAAAGILNQSDVAFNGRSFVALPVSALGGVERVVGFQSEHPVIEPDFLHEQIQRPLSVITRSRNDVDVVVTTPYRVAVIDAITQVDGGDVLSKIQVSKPSAAGPDLLIL